MGNSRTADKFVVRMPDGLREQIQDVAENNHRSMNGEIIHRLERSLAIDQELEHQKNLVRLLSLRLADLEQPA